MSRADDLAELGLVTDARPTPAALKEAYHARSLERHPDRGGDVEAFNQLVAAYDRLRAWVERPQTCPTCGGQRRLSTTRGFYVTLKTCPTCRGKGRV